MTDREAQLPFATLPKNVELHGHPVELHAVSAIRRLELVGTRLAIPVSPLPGEGLPDLYLRAITRNGETFASRLWPRLAGVPKAYYSHRNFIDLKVEDSAFSRFLGTPLGDADVAPLRYTRARAGTVSFFGTVLRVASFSAQRRVSPRFLADSGYQKAIWAVAPLGFDPTNKERLLSHCPSCDRKLTFERVQSLFLCPFCGDREGAKVDFRDFPQPLVELETFENIDLACALIDPAQKSRPESVFHPDLRAIERGQLFEFIVLLATLIDRLGPAGEGPHVSVFALDKAAEAIRRYPVGLMEVGELVSGVGVRKRNRTFQHPISREVSSYRGYFGLDFAKIVKNQLRSGLEPDAETMPLPSTRASKFRRPHPRTKQLGGFDVSDSNDRFAFAMLLARESREVRSEAKNAGLPLVELVSLYDQGLVRCADDELCTYLSDAKPVESLASRLASLSVSAAPGASLLTDAIFAFAGGKVVWRQVLSLVLQGELPVKLMEGQGSLMKRLLATDLGRVAEACNQIQAGDQTNSGVVLTNSDASFYLSVTDAEVARLVTNGLMPSGGIDLAAVRAFQQAYINPSEILRFLRVKQHHTRSTAVIFKRILEAGIAPLHKNPSTRARAAVHDYFRHLGYL